MLRFESDIKFPTGNLYAIGDIHGDIRALIICLRDLCKVIVSNNITDKLLQTRRDEYMIEMINRDVDLYDTRLYDQSLGYKWIGGTSIVVIVGDILDNLRRVDDYNNKNIDYPMEEVKMLLFLNTMKFMAQREGGRIITLLGNHDVLNLNGSSIDSFVSEKALRTKIKISGRDYDRKTFFKIGNYGSVLMSYGGFGILVKVNDFVFTHACLLRDFPFRDIVKVNNDINEYFDKGQYDEISEILHSTRMYSFLNNRFQSYWYDVVSYDKDDTSFCSGLVRTINNVFPGIEPLPILVVGHEVQSSAFKPLTESQKVYSLSRVTEKGHRTRSVVTTPINVQPKTPKDYESTFTMNCTLQRRGYPLIIRIDVAMSTMFDMPYHPKYKNPAKDRIEEIEISSEKLLRIKSRCPHVLHIEYNSGNIEKIESIRSSTYNTLLHQNRIRQPDYPKNIYDFIGVPY